MAVSPEIWAPELDALIAAPEQHKLLMENEFVRVLETRIEPGQRTPIHTHCWPCTNYILSGSHFIRRDDKGEVLLDSKQRNVVLSAGQAIWSAPLPPHSFENVGDTPVHLISVEMKIKA